MKRKSLLFLLLFALIAPWAANAQTLTVCNGTENNEYVPFYGYYADESQHNQMIFPATDLTAMNGMDITQMVFYIDPNAANGSYTAASRLGTWTVSLGETTATTLSGLDNTTTLTQVYQGYFDCSTGTLTLPFDGEYIYHGGNLLLDLTHEAASWNHWFFLGVTANGASYCYNAQRNFLPKTTFSYQTPTACPTPTLGAAEYITEEGASFQWTENGSATQWQLQYSTSNDFANPTTIERNGIPAYAITGLSSATAYYVHVRSYCGDGEWSNWSNTVVFRTLCGAYGLPYAYGFEDAGDLECWIVSGSTSASTGIASASDAPEGSKVFRFHYSEQNAYLISPVFNGTSAGLSVTFQYMNSSTTTSYTEQFQVGYTTSATETDPTAFTYGETIYGQNEWVTYENVFPANTKRIAIKYIYTDGMYLRLDDFTFEAPSSCRKPTDLDVADITTSTATLRWTENGEATAWQVEVTDLDGGQVTTWDATTNPYQIVGLFEDTPYSVRVNPVCDVDKWSDPITFRTPETCPKPTNVTVSNVEPFAATVSWTGTASSYNLAIQEPVFFYGFEDAEPWVEDNFAPCTTYDGDGLTTYQITDWTPLGEYQFVGSMMTLQSGVTDFASAHGGELFGGFVSGIPAGDVEHNDDYFILPAITIEDGFVFEFWASSLLDNWGLEHMRVGVYGGNGTITDYLAGSATEYVEVPNGWTKYSYNLSRFAGQSIQLAINSLCPDAYILGIDDIFVGYNTPTAQAVVYNNVTSPYTLELDQETTYQVLVQSACGEDGNSAWVFDVFTTPSNCAAPTALESTDVMPHSATLNWTGYQDSYTVRYRTAEHRETYYFTNFNDGYEVAHEEGWNWEGNIIYGFSDPIYNIPGENNYFLQMGWSTTEETYIFSPELPAYASGATLEFYYFGNSVDNTFQVGYSTTTNDADAFTWSDPIQAPLQTYTLFSEMLADGIKYVAFKATASSSSAAIFIDNFGVFGNLVPAGEWREVEVNALPYTLEDLADLTEYEWQVQGINASCDGGVTEWSEIATFTTLDGCQIPTTLTEDAIAGTSATLSWEGIATSYDLRYRTSIDAEIYFYDDLSEYEIISEDEGLYEIGNWTTVNLEEGGGNYGGEFVFMYTENPPQYLISPELTLPADETCTLSFIYAAYDAGYPESFKVGYSSTTNDVSAFTWSEEVTNITTTSGAYYTEVVPAGTKYFAIQCTSDDQFALIVTNFMIYGPITPAGEWQYVYNVTSPYTLTGLTPETAYDWQVSNAGCDNWSTEDAFFVTGITTTQTIELAAGTNWVSFNVDITLDDLKAALLAANNASGIVINSQTEGVTTWNGRAWRGDLSNLDVSQLYMIDVPAACEITLESMPVDPTEHSYDIVIGSNWIGFPLSVSMTLSDAFASIAVQNDQVTSQNDGFSNFNGRMWRGNLGQLVPGQGYIYDSSHQATLVFPTSSSKATQNGTFNMKSLQNKNSIKAINLPTSDKRKHSVVSISKKVSVVSIPNNVKCIKQIRNK